MLAKNLLSARGDGQARKTREAKSDETLDRVITDTTTSSCYNSASGWQNEAKMINNFNRPSSRDDYSPVSIVAGAYSQTLPALRSREHSDVAADLLQAITTCRLAELTVM